MSELKRKSERAIAKATMDDLKRVNWWNTSSGLKAECPGIENSPCWSSFAEEYDKSEHEKKRLKEWLTSRTWKGFSPGLSDLIDDAEEATEETEGAGKKLGLSILEIIKGGREFNELVEGVKLRRKKISGVSEAVWALKCFAEREKKLPTRIELNRESYLIKNLTKKEIPMKTWLKEHSQFEEFEFGHRLGNDRVYFMEFDHATVRIHTYFDREGAKKHFRWKPKGSTFSEVLGKAGLRGLD